MQGTARIVDPKSDREPLVVALGKPVTVVFTNLTAPHLANLGAKDYRLQDKYLRWYTEHDIPVLLFVPSGKDAYVHYFV